MRGSYYALNERPICAKCKPVFAKRIEKGQAFVGAAIVGILTALGGMIAMTIVVSIFSFAKIFLLIPIGWGIGKAIMTTTGDYGGRKYQILAVALTWTAISVGLMIPAAREAKAEAARRAVVAEKTRGTVAGQNAQLKEAMEDIASDSTFLGTDSSAAAEDTEADPPPVVTHDDAPRRPNIVLLFFILPLISMMGFGLHVAAVGVLALGYSLLQAWKRTDGQGLELNLSGPFKVGSGPIPAK